MKYRIAKTETVCTTRFTRNGDCVGNGNDVEVEEGQVVELQGPPTYDEESDVWVLVMHNEYPDHVGDVWWNVTECPTEVDVNAPKMLIDMVGSYVTVAYLEGYIAGVAAGRADVDPAADVALLETLEPDVNCEADETGVSDKTRVLEILRAQITERTANFI